jgi:putative Mn2+ efflux pump MntP
MSASTLALLLSLALDDFAAGIAYGLAGLPRARWFRVGLIFSFFGVLLPLVGILAGRWLSDALGAAVAYLAGAFLIVTGVRALGDAVLADDEGTRQSSLSLETQSVALTALAVALDTTAVGLALGLTQLRLGPVLGYLAVQAFVAVLLGLALGRRVGARLGRAAAALAGAVFVLYGLALVFQTASGGSGG